MFPKTASEKTSKSKFSPLIILLALFSFAPAALADNAMPHVLLKTSMGNIELELNRTQAPITVDNFLYYVNSGFYKNTLFHRVIPGFMIQGGGFEQDMQIKITHSPIKNEADNGLLNQRGTIAMARTRDKDSATSQFFINLENNDFLNHGQRDFGYAVFGKVVSGMDVVDRISQVATHQLGRQQNVPDQPVLILSATELAAKKH